MASSPGIRIGTLASALLTVSVLASQTASKPTSRKVLGSTPAWEAAVLKEAKAFLATETFKLQHPGEDLSRYKLTGATLIRHPRLAELLPGHRFYFAHVRSRREQVFRGKTYEHFYVTYFMCRVDTKTGRAWFVDRGRAVGNEKWRFDVVDFLQKQDVRVRDRASVRRFHELYRVLSRISRGGGMPVAKTQKIAKLSQVEKKLGLGTPKPKPPLVAEPMPHVVESKSHWSAVIAGRRCDDWGMPVHAWFRWLSFGKKSGKLLGLKHANGKVWPNKDFNAKVFQAEVDRFCAELAKQE